MPVAEMILRILELDPRSIELLSRTKPCLKIMLSETELEVIAGGQK